VNKELDKKGGYASTATETVKEFPKIHHRK
jgi:hypothetical protein